MNKLTYIFLTLSLILASSLSSCCQNSQKLVILHTNDSHSQITPQTTGAGVGLGGYERREQYINKVRQENKNVILVDAGDYSQGTPFFTLFKGDVEIELMNALKYDVVCIGNHEFDNGPAELARRISNANFPFVCANYDFSKSELANSIKPYTIIEKAGKRIGVIGILTNIKTLVSPKHTENIKYNHPYKIINQLALELKNKQKCDLIILLTHSGFNKGTEQNPTDDLMAMNSENVDIIIGGHSHTNIKEQAVYKNKLGKDVIVVTAGEKGEHVGRIDIEF